MDIIEDAIRVARKYYDDDTYYHAMRVAGYVTNNNLIPKDKMEVCVALAIMHDLIEDTDFNYFRDTDQEIYNTYIEKCLEILTRDQENSSYEDYLNNIKKNYNSYPEAYWVKMDDIKDHLCQTETLTDKLKEKYLKALPYLL